jgi:hypothetical protein
MPVEKLPVDDVDLNMWRAAGRRLSTIAGTVRMTSPRRHQLINMLSIRAVAEAAF